MVGVRGLNNVKSFGVSHGEIPQVWRAQSLALQARRIWREIAFRIQCCGRIHGSGRLTYVGY